MILSGHIFLKGKTAQSQMGVWVAKLIFHVRKQFLFIPSKATGNLKIETLLNSLNTPTPHLNTTFMDLLFTINIFETDIFLQWEIITHFRCIS